MSEKIRQLFEMLALSMAGEIFMASTQWKVTAHDRKSIKQQLRGGDAVVTVTHGSHLGFGRSWMSRRDVVIDVDVSARAQRKPPNACPL